MKYPQFIHALLILVNFQIFISGSVFATETEAETRCQELLLSKRSSLYCYGYCHDNISRLVNESLRLGISLKKATVLVLFPIVRFKAGYQNNILVNPSSSGFPIKEWQWHVALEVNGKILDFDYLMNEELPGVDKYFNSMFFRPENKLMRLNQILVIKVPAEEYFQNMTERNWMPLSYWTGENNGNYKPNQDFPPELQERFRIRHELAQKYERISAEDYLKTFAR